MSQERQGAFSRVAVVNRGEPAMRLINAVREWNAEGRPALRVIAVYTAEVAGARRAAVVDRRRGELRIPPVAEHEARPAVADLAFGAGQGRLAVLVGDLEHDARDGRSGAGPAPHRGQPRGCRGIGEQPVQGHLDEGCRRHAHRALVLGDPPQARLGVPDVHQVDARPQDADQRSSGSSPRVSGSSQNSTITSAAGKKVTRPATANR
jgi:hypothetical protein